MTKLLISTASFYPSRLGGPANALYWLSKTLVKKGISVSVVTTDNHIETGEVKVDQWSCLDGIAVRYCDSSSFSLLKMLWHSFIEMRSCETIMLCDMFQPQILFVAVMSRICRKRIIWSPRGELFTPALKGSVVKRCYVGFVRKFFGGYATFHATSNEEQEMILNHIGSNTKVIVIPNYIELPLIFNREPQSIPYFLFVGRINRIKALDRLILGLAKSNLFKRSGYILKIVGPDQDGCQQELETIIGDNGLENKVEFVGNLFGEEKSQIYANAYFSCLMSHSENFGNVVVEALSQGTPVIASQGTPWQGLEEEGAGYWISNDPESIAECIDKVISLEEEDYLVMRKHAKQYANSFDVDINIHNWVEVLQ